MANFIIPTLYQKDYPVMPDEYDRGIMSVLPEIWDSHFNHPTDYPRVGDFVIMPDGSFERAAYVWPDGVQTCNQGSFHLGTCGASMSGSLNDAIPKDKLVNTGDRKEGDFWFFHHNMAHAHNAVGLKCGCRVFKVI